jgi:uroporphyrinogen decarboxylase
MTSRERVLTALDRGVPDRIPLDFWATAEVIEKLQAHFGTEDVGEVRRRLHVDGLGGAEAAYIGPPPAVHPDGMTENYWGMRYQPIQYATGVYNEQCHYPLAFAETVADLDAYCWPSLDWFDFSGVRAVCEAQRDLAIMGGYSAPLYYYNQLRGLEESLVDMAARPELAHAILGRLTDFFYGYVERLFEAADGLIDTTQLTDDLGTQTGLMISEAMIDEFLMPHYRRLAELMQDHGVRIFHHDDGAMWPLLPKLNDVGITILNPVQYRCGNIDLNWLKDTYGDRLAFHGGVDNQEVLPFGSVAEVIAETRRLIASLGRGGGYMLASCHNLQAVTPVENILAMYETAYEEGRY